MRTYVGFCNCFPAHDTYRQFIERLATDRYLWQSRANYCDMRPYGRQHQWDEFFASFEVDSVNEVSRQTRFTLMVPDWSMHVFNVRFQVLRRSECFVALPALNCGPSSSRESQVSNSLQRPLRTRDTGFLSSARALLHNVTSDSTC